MKEQEETEGMFEREWREAFENARQEPPKIVWSEIDRALLHDQVHGYRKRAVYYRWASAAIFLLATTFGLLQLFSSEFSKQETAIREDAPATVQLPESSDNLALNIAINKTTGDEVEQVVSRGEQKNQVNNQKSNSEKSPTIQSVDVGEDQPRTGLDEVNSGGASYQGDAYLALGEMEEPEVLLTEEEEPVEYLYYNENTLAVSAKQPDMSLADPKIKDHLYMVANPANAKKMRSGIVVEGVEDRYWAGVDMSSGTFDPNFQNASSSLNSSLVLNPGSQYSRVESDVLSSVDPAVQESMSSGQLVSFGIDMGMRVSEKWSVHGGFQYVKADATNNTNMVVASTQIVETIAVTKQVRGVTQVQDIVQQEEVVMYNYEDIELDNQFQFASIPINVGYRVIDKKFSVQLNGGVSTNIYLGNKLSSSDAQVAEVTIGPGSSSPYKQFSFMGLAGIQLGYEFISNFDVLLQPNYRHSLNDLTKGDSDFIASPSGFGVQTGIRYRFD